MPPLREIQEQLRVIEFYRDHVGKDCKYFSDLADRYAYWANSLSSVTDVTTQNRTHVEYETYWRNDRLDGFLEEMLEGLRSLEWLLKWSRGEVPAPHQPRPGPAPWQENSES